MEAAWTADQIEWIRTCALASGFDLAGVAAAPAAEEPSGTLTADRFAAWIDQGHAGEMDYLKRRNAEGGALLRSSARAAMPWARSVIVCALNYNLTGSAAAPLSIDAASPEAGWIARYAWTGDEQGQPVDYHDDLLRRLQQVEAALQQTTPCQTRCYVDTGPLLERDFAARAGIGWIGKNTCVLNQQQGSWLLLGVIVTSLPVAAQAMLAPDRCGSCTRCIDACPTHALLPPTPENGHTRAMDASLCIAYLTIEKKGAIAEDLRAPMGRQVFGCDICQEVCPWNSRAKPAQKPGLSRRDQLINPSLAWLAGLDQAGFKRLFAGSPLERTRRKRLLRNVAIAMGNSGCESFLPRLETWAMDATDSVLQEAAAWALRRLQKQQESSVTTSASIKATA
jgi:epoxyqueuosine reductase